MMRSVRAWLICLGSVTTVACFLTNAAAETRATKTWGFSVYSGANLRSGQKVVGRAKGSCWTQSLTVSDRSDAWRCMVGNEIHDPCFSPPTGTRVACVASPYAHHVFLISLDTPLPAHSKTFLTPHGQPWAIKLANGDTCVFLAGAMPVERGMRGNYGCSRGMAFGDADKSGSIWRIYYKRDSSLHRVAIVEAVF